ncbi:MAG: fibronectin type III domain-containing protein [bacterium]
MSILSRIKQILTNKRFQKIIIISLFLIPLIALVIFLVRFLTEPSINPENVRLTNLTDQSFTLSWTTKNLTTTGAVYVLENSNFVPILSRITSKKFYDSRDDLQVNWYQDFNRERLFTHSVDISGLKPETKYNFRIESGNFIYDVTNQLGSDNITTLITPDNNVTPSPIYGRVMRADEINPQMGALVYLTLENDGKYSSQLSTVTTYNGTYTLDLSNSRDEDSKVFSASDRTILHFEVDSGNRGKLTYQQTNTATDPVIDISLKNEVEDKNAVVSLGDSITSTLNPIATNIESIVASVNAEAITTNIVKSFDDLSSYPEIRIFKTTFFPILILVILTYGILTWKNIWKRIKDNSTKINKYASIFVILLTIFQLTFPIAVYAKDNSNSTNSEPVFSQLANSLQKTLGSGLIEKVYAESCGSDGKSVCNAQGQCIANCANFNAPTSKASSAATTQAPECTSGSQCNGKTVQNCSGGKWINGEVCDGTTRKCDGGKCVDTNPAPAPATSTASPATAAPSTYSCGVAGSRCGRGGTCTPNGCVGETPIPDCSAGQTRCDGKTVQNCQNGKWNNFQFCDGTSQRCAAGACVGTNTCVTEDVNMGCEITNGIYTGKYKVSHKKTDCSASVETITDNSKCPVSTTGYAKVCEATTKQGDCVAGANMRKKYDVKPDCSVVERSEYDPSCSNTSYSPTPKDQKDAQAGAKKVTASIAKVSKTELDTSKDLASSNPSSTGNCSLSDLGKQYDNGGSCYQCIHTGNAEKISDKACASMTSSGSYACGSDITIGGGYRFSKGGKCYQCFMPNSSATEVSCSTQIGAKVPESKLAGNVNCSDLDSAGLTGSLANQKCVTGLDREGNLTFRTSALSDKDGDGYTSDVDCNDSDPSVHPGATDTPTEDKNCDGKISYVFQKLNSGCSSSSQCEGGLVCALATSKGGNDEYKCQKTIQTALKDDIQAALDSGKGDWNKLIGGYTSGRFTNYAKSCPEAKNPQDCNDNGIPDVLEQAYGVNTSANGKEIEKILTTAVKTDCEKRIKSGSYSGSQGECEVDTFDHSGFESLGSYLGARKLNGEGSSDLFTSNYAGSQAEIKAVLDKHSKEGNAFKCASGESLNNADQAYCKTILQDLNKDCAQNQTSKSGSLSAVGTGGGKLCLTDVLASTTLGVGNLAKLLTNDTAEQAAYQNYCTSFKKQTGLSCNETSSKIVEDTSSGTINDKYLEAGTLNLLSVQFASKTDQELKDNCENQKARGFLSSSFDCSKVKSDSKYYENSDKFTKLLSQYSDSIGTISQLSDSEKESVLSKIKDAAANLGLDPNKLEAFIRANSPDIKELSYKLLFKDFMDKQGAGSSNTDYALSIYSYADCITSPTKSDLGSAFSNSGFAASVNPNCKTEPVKVVTVGENGPALSGVKRCAPSTSFGLDLTNYGKVCSANSECGGSSCTSVDNGVENYYLARNGTKLPNGETVDLSQELQLKSNLDQTELSLNLLGTTAVLGSAFDVIDIATTAYEAGKGITEVTKTLLNKASISATESKSTSALLEEIARVYGKNAGDLTAEELNSAKTFMNSRSIVELGLANSDTEAKTLLENLSKVKTTQIQEWWNETKTAYKDILNSSTDLEGATALATNPNWKTVNLPGAGTYQSGPGGMVIIRPRGITNSDLRLENEIFERLVGRQQSSLNYTNVTNQVRSAIKSQQDVLKAGGEINSLGIRISLVNPRTGQATLANDYYGSLSWITHPSTNPNAIKPVFVSSDIVSQKFMNDQLFKPIGVSNDFLQATINNPLLFEADSAVGGWASANRPVAVVMGRVEAFTNGTSATIEQGIIDILCHEACHKGIQVSNYRYITNPLEKEAARNVTEALTEVIGVDGVNRTAWRGLNEPLGYPTQVRNLQTIQDFLVKNYGAKEASFQIGRMATDPVGSIHEFLSLIDKDTNRAAQMVIEAMNAPVVKGTQTSNSGNNSDKLIKLTNEPNIITSDLEGNLKLSPCYASTSEDKNVSISTCPDSENLKVTLIPQTSPIFEQQSGSVKLFNPINGQIIDFSESGITLDYSLAKNLKVIFQNPEKKKIDLANYSFQQIFDSKQAYYNLQQGWQTFNPVLNPGDKYTASTLLSDFAKQGGYATDISTYTDGRWQTYKIRGEEVFSDQDFKIEPGKGYFIKVQKGINFEFNGTPSETPSQVVINNGWNLIGINPGFIKAQSGEWNFNPSKFIYNTPEGKSTVDSKLTGNTSDNVLGYTAFNLIKSMNNNNLGTKIVTKWDSGRYTNAITDKDTSGKTIDYGADFYIDPQKAYFVRVDKNTTNSFTP